MKEDKCIAVNIATPKGVFTGTFVKTTKVSEVIAAVIKEHELDGSDAFDLVFSGQELSPHDRPLVSFGITSPANLELIATGSGV